MISLSYMLLASVALTIMSMSVQTIGLRLPTFEVVFFRSVFHLALIMPFLFKEPRPRELKTILSLILRGALGFCGILCLFVSLKSLPLSIATLLAWSSPLFTVVFAVLILKERLTVPITLALAGSTFGLFLLATPCGKTVDVSWLAVLISLLGAAAAGLAYLALKVNTGRASVSWIAFYFSGVALLGALPGTVQDFVSPSVEMWGLLFMVGFGAAVYQFGITQAYKNGEASRVAPLGLLVPIFGTASDFVFSHKVLSAEQNWGALLLVVGIGVTAYLSNTSSTNKKSEKITVVEIGKVIKT